MDGTVDSHRTRKENSMTDKRKDRLKHQISEVKWSIRHQTSVRDSHLEHAQTATTPFEAEFWDRLAHEKSMALIRANAWLLCLEDELAGSDVL